MAADPVDAVVAAFRAEGMAGDPEEIRRFARVAVEACERDAVRALREIRDLALNEGRPETDDFAHHVYERADAALAEIGGA